ncbi:hypothetical protein [Undibacterium crateris]|uniref:hypothetical protein n=1 Tax=Undibacterium crateris TaxID=2528175 RepID=UPI001389A38E|nr:hypothetical protein [Undibacterium crateris]NDI85056.1 hypothetical protein [Undibacterium crateris]
MGEQSAQYNSKDTVQVAEYVSGLKENSIGSSGTFDSAAAMEYTSASQANSVVPAKLQVILDEMPKENADRIVKGLLDGVASYERQHGVAPTADVIESAIHQAYATTEEARKKYTLDSASNAHSDPLSLQPNRAVIAITAAISEAIPVANYMAADIGSNQAKLIIVSHTAGNQFGGYKQNDIMDGINSGRAYINSARCHSLTRTADAFGDKITANQISSELCDQNGSPVKLMRGRTQIYINGFFAAREANGSGSASASAIVGGVTIGGVPYLISGTVNLDTGVVAITTDTPLPANTKVVAEGFIDFERSPGTIPFISTNATSFDLYANPWKVNTEQTIDTRTQFSNELGLDPAAESMLAIRNQFANERHFNVLQKAARLGSTNNITFDFNWSNFGLQKTRAQIWQDFAAILNASSQQMAEDTMDHGITHLYVGKSMAANLQTADATIFEPSGITARPSIYRLGRLFGMYEVYYNPQAVEANGGASSQVVCIGRSTQVARNPFVLGDAVPPTIIPLTATRDQVSGAGFYARNFTAVNPHQPSAAGCALINIINLK